MKWIYLIFILVLIAGCGGVKTVQQVTVTSEAKSEATEAKLPKIHIPEAKNINNAKQVAQAFREVQSLKNARTLDFQTLKEVNEKTQFSGAVITRCDLEILRAFVANGWAPAIILRSPSGPHRARTVIGFNDPPQELILADPIDLGEMTQMRFGYADFLRMWVDQQRSCMLIFTQYTDESLIKNALWQFLPREKTDSITIRTQTRTK